MYFSVSNLRLKQSQAGYTLIEMMVAVTILAITMLGLGGLVTTSIQNNLENDLRNLALRMTTETAAALRTQPFDAIVDGNLEPYDENNVAMGDDFEFFPNPVQKVRSGNRTFTVTWDVDENSSTSDLLVISIQVQYTHRGQDHINNSTIYRLRDS